MKSTSLTILLGLSLTLGGAITSRANDQQTIRIPQGRGQYVEVQVAKPTTVALFAPTSRHVEKAASAQSNSGLRPVTVTNSHGSSVTLFERTK